MDEERVADSGGGEELDSVGDCEGALEAATRCECRRRAHRLQSKGQHHPQSKQLKERLTKVDSRPLLTRLNEDPNHRSEEHATLSREALAVTNLAQRLLRLVRLDKRLDLGLEFGVLDGEVPQFGEVRTRLVDIAARDKVARRFGGEGRAEEEEKALRLRGLVGILGGGQERTKTSWTPMGILQVTEPVRLRNV